MVHCEVPTPTTKYTLDSIDEKIIAKFILFAKKIFSTGKSLFSKISSFYVEKF